MISLVLCACAMRTGANRAPMTPAPGWSFGKCLLFHDTSMI